MQKLNLKLSKSKTKNINPNIFDFTYSPKFVKIGINLDTLIVLHKTGMNTSILINMITELLFMKGYKANKLNNILLKSRSITASFLNPSDNLEYFVKLVNFPNGTDEFVGGNKMQQYNYCIPSISLSKSEGIEMLLQHKLPLESEECGLLIDAIEDDSFNFSHFSKFLDKQLENIEESLFIGVEKSYNDKFFYERTHGQLLNGKVGRIDNFYSLRTLSIEDKNIEFSNFLDSNISVNNSAIKIKFSDIIKQSQQILSPDKKRPLAFCHGDFHEMNIFYNKRDGDTKFGFIDLETAGINSVLSDAIIFLTYLTIYADYLVPKYRPQYLEGRNHLIHNINTHHLNLNYLVSITKKNINISGFDKFGTSYKRKEFARNYIDNYIYPLIETISKRYTENKISFQNMDEIIKYSIFMRLFLVFNVSDFTSNDQATIISLITKTFTDSVSINATQKYMPSMESFYKNL